MVWPRPPGNKTLAPPAKFEHTLESVQGTATSVFPVENICYKFFPVHLHCPLIIYEAFLSFFHIIELFVLDNLLFTLVLPYCMLTLFLLLLHYYCFNFIFWSYDL